MLIVSLVVAVFMISVLAAVYRFGGGAILLVSGFFAFLVFFSPLLLGTLFVLTLITLVCRAAGASVKKFLACSCIAAVLAHGILGFMLMQPVLELRREFPIESLRHRLAYERRATAGEKEELANANNDASNLAADAAKSDQGDRLSQLEDRLEHSQWNEHRGAFRYRNHALARLYQAHESIVGAFVDSPGFGIGRMAAMGAPTRRNIEMPPIRPIPLPEKTPQQLLPSSDVGTPPIVAADAEDQGGLAMKHSLASLHIEGTADFADPLAFGYVRDLDHTIGFQPHAFTQIPRISTENTEATSWQIGKLELVSLLKHEQPKVYESKNLPNMQELEAVPTRSLDAFESAALDKLRGGEDLVVSTGSQEIRMLGSLRAAKQCIACHQVDRGTLLGAFTYRLVSDQPVDQPKAEQPPTKPAS